MLGFEVGMVAQPVAGTLDLDHVGMMEQPIEQRHCDHWTAEDVAPIGEALVRGYDHRALLIPCIGQLEEQDAITSGEGQVADLVDLC